MVKFGVFVGIVFVVSGCIGNVSVLKLLILNLFVLL